MAYARIDVSYRHDERFEKIPERSRAAAKALMLDAILNSAEMLADGRVSRAVLLTFCEDNGVKKGRSVIAYCVENDLLRELRPGFFEIVNWQEFHSSRRDVEDQRTRSTERKRQQRHRQLQLDVPTDVTAGHTNGVTGGQEGPSRAHARASTATDTTTETTQQQDHKDLEEPPPAETAAAEPHQVEAPRPSRIAQVVDEFAPGDTDSINHIEPLATQLPADTFEQLVEKVRTRRPDNPAGLLRKFLTDELRQRLRNNIQQPAGIVVSSPIERMKHDEPERYLDLMAHALDKPAVEHYLATYVTDEEHRIELRDRWHDARTAAA